MRAVKVVWQQYHPSEETLRLLEEFRRMLNDCVRIGLETSSTSLKALYLKAYSQLADYDVMSYYKLCAISRATGILRSYRKAKRKGKPVGRLHARRLQLTTCYGFKVAGRKLLLPFRPHAPISIPLNMHVLGVLSKPGQTVRSVTITADRVVVAFATEVVEIAPEGFVGVDSNLDNLTLADSNGKVEQYDLSKTTQIKSRYRAVKARFTRNDVRIRRRVFQKYGGKQRERVSHILHNISKHIVEDAKAKRFGVVMENLTGIRKLYRKGNGQGSEYRGRLNSWAFRELQRQIDYKARWESLPVLYVQPHGSSSKCSVCGRKLMPEENRLMRCAGCGFTVDRDVNAAKNILAKGLRFGPVAPAIEALAQERPPANPESRCR